MNVKAQHERAGADIGALTEEVWRTLDEQELLNLLVEAVNIASPSGEELPLARFLAGCMDTLGMASELQEYGPAQANAVGRIEGSGEAPCLMLYSPIDTAFRGSADEDSPWIDLEARRDQVPAATREGQVVTGLGAHNPKGHAVCALLAAGAIARSGVALAGDLVVALCGGGMPANPPASAAQRTIGHGVGCEHVLRRVSLPDMAIVAKPGKVANEEVGVSWFRVRVTGLLGYAGTRHVVEHRNPIVHAATVVGELEDWFREYTRDNSTDAIAPQGSIGSIRAGWPHKPTFIPECCDIYLDLRVSPYTDLQDVERQFRSGIERIAARHPEISLSAEMLFGIPGSRTDPSERVICSAIRAWEYATGEVYEPPTGGSGATEANVLRARGIPTARVGMPAPPEKLKYGGRFSMGEAHLASMKALTRMLIYSALDICMPSASRSPIRRNNG